jgi:hypothetical protein
MKNYYDEVLRGEMAETSNDIFMNVQCLFKDRNTIQHSTLLWREISPTESKGTLQEDGKYKNPNVFTS